MAIFPILLAFLIVETSCLSFWSRFSHSAFSQDPRFIVTSSTSPLVGRNMGVQFETEQNVAKEIYSTLQVNLGVWPRNLESFGHSHSGYTPTILTAYHMMMKCIHRSLPDYDRHAYFGLVGWTF